MPGKQEHSSRAQSPKRCSSSVLSASPKRCSSSVLSASPKRYFSSVLSASPKRYFSSALSASPKRRHFHTLLHPGAPKFAQTQISPSPFFSPNPLFSPPISPLLPPHLPSSPIVPPSSPGEAFRGRVKRRKPNKILEK